MNDLAKILLSNEFIIVYGIVLTLIIMIIITFLVDNGQKKKDLLKEDKRKIEKEEILPVIEDKSMEITKLDEMLETPTVTSMDTSLKEVVNKEEQPLKEEIRYVDEAMEKVEAQLELQRITEELQKQEEQPLNIELTNFEQEQEDTAIISLDELMKKADILYEQNEIVQYEDEGNEPINLIELEARMHEQEKIKETVKLDDFNTVKEVKVIENQGIEKPKKFKNSPVISPVFGTLDNEVPKETALELENTANYDKLDEEIRKTNEFLQILKELQKKLD